MPRKRIGDLLVESGTITDEQLQEALAYQRDRQLRLGDALMELGMISENELIQILEFQFGIPHVSLSRYRIDPDAPHLIHEEMAKRHEVIPIRKDGVKLTVAMSDPLDYYAIDDLRMLTGMEIQPVIAGSREIRQYIERFYGLSESVSELLKSARIEEEVSAAAVTEDDAPIIRLVNQLITQAVARQVSDIHIEPHPNDVVIRYRVDGQLRREQVLPKQMHSVLLTRIKVMSGLNIAERRLPQDGRMQLERQFRNIDVRVSTLPTVHGEKAVLRVLDRNQALMDVAALNFAPEHEAYFRKVLSFSSGMVLITGPTGSGKTTTLYAALSLLNSETRNIITVEDPVEYELVGVNQTQVNNVIGYSFARGLRSILRQDPDIVMVGEIRDEETAEIAVRAALTGHLVLSTVHTNDAPSTVARLVEMGVEPYLVASALAGILSQRLVRRLCSNCRHEVTLSDVEAAFAERHGFAAHQRFYAGKGCEVCQRTGFKGRLAIQELLPMDETVRRLTLQGDGGHRIRQYMKDANLPTLAVDGLNKALQGLTTAGEIMRATLRD